ncbi:MAG: glycosyltransferase, partial [Gemmatimonadaceae bacterium]
MIDSPRPVRISVVTPTHNRPQSLLRLLHALRDGSFPSGDFEAVIVADGCSDDTVTRARAEPLPFRVSVLEQNPGRGAAAARNPRAAHAAGELLGVIDDDIEPTPPLRAAHWGEC